MKDTTARALSTVAIWLAVAIVLGGGVFQRGWTGDAALMVLMSVVLIVCGSAVGATVAVWRGSSRPDDSSRDAPGPKSAS